MNNITTIFVSLWTHPAMLTYGVPRIHYEPYSREEVIDILCLSTPILDPSISYDGRNMSEEYFLNMWGQYCGLVYDVYHAVGRDVVFQRKLTRRLWPVFLKPVKDDIVNIRDSRSLLTRFAQTLKTDNTVDEMFSIPADNTVRLRAFDFPEYTSYLLIAAYLSSFNPPRMDTRYFSRSRETRLRKPHNRKSGGKIAHYKKLNLPRLFEFERMLAIFHAIVPEKLVATADIPSQTATLLSLRLLTRQTSVDVLDSSGKWRVNVKDEQIRRVCDRVHLNLADYLHV